MIWHYTEAEGLPSSMVYDMVQDLDGRLWFATRAGVAAYDGVSWDIYNRDSGLALHLINWLAVDRNNRVWGATDVDTASFNCAWFEGGEWTRIPSPDLDLDGELVITSFALIDGHDQVNLCVGTHSNGVFIWNGQSWTQAFKTEGQTARVVNAVLGIDGGFLIGTSAGLWFFDSSRGAGRMYDDINLPVDEIWGLAMEREAGENGMTGAGSRLWVLGENALGVYDYRSRRFERFWEIDESLFSSGFSRFSVQPDYYGGVYLGNHFSLFYYNPDTDKLQRMGLESGLDWEGVNAILVDFEKNVWFSSDRGVGKLASRRFSSYQTEQGLVEDEVSAVIEYQPGKFVFGHNIGLTVYDGSRFHPILFPYHNEPERVAYRVSDLAVDRQGHVWAAATKGGLVKIIAPDRLIWYGSKHGVNGTISSVEVDPSGQIWAADSDGLKRLENERFVPVKTGSIPNVAIRKIETSSDGLIYLATYRQGVLVGENGSWHQFQSQDDLGYNSVFAVLKDHRDRLLVGTQNGLMIAVDGTLRKFRDEKFSLDRPVYQLLEDKKNNLWCGTNSGIIRWNGMSSQHYSIVDGLIGLETNRAAVIEDTRGRIWIGTNRGISVFDPFFDAVPLEFPPPKVHLLDVRIHDTNLSNLKRTRLRASENDLDFHFRVVSFINESANRIRYKLVGYDRDWREEQSPLQQMVRYTNLPPGEYTFALQGRNAYGRWSNTFSTATLSIKKPFYLRSWFYILSIILLTVIFSLIVQFVLQRRNARLLEKKIEVRTRQLQITEQKYRDLFEASRDMIFFCTASGDLVELNEAGIRLLGFNRKEEVVNRFTIRDFLPESKILNLLFAEIEKNGFVSGYETRILDREKSPVWILLSLSPTISQDDEIEGFWGIARDINEEKELKAKLEQAQKMEAVGTLAGGVAHDLNNILAGLTSYPELLLMKIPEDSPLRKPITIVKQTGEKAAAMVEDLLTLARRGVKTDTVIDLNEIIDEYLKSNQCAMLMAYHPGVRFDVDTDSELLNVLGSSIHIFKTVMNLSSNAAEAMKNGGIIKIITLNLSVDTPLVKYETIPPGDYVILKVSDTGIGIPPDRLPQIFEPFYTKKVMGRSGTGLGMSVVWATVKDHKGYINIESREGSGTTFTIYFPASRKKLLEKDGDTSLEGMKGNESILVVDDVEEQRDISNSILSMLGYKVTIRSSGEAAVEYLSDHEVDLVILDMIMEPGIDGLETFQRIVAIRPGQKAIIVSGYSETERVKELQRLGAGEYLKKPFTIKALGQAVRKELDR